MVNKDASPAAKVVATLSRENLEKFNAKLVLEKDLVPGS